MDSSPNNALYHFSEYPFRSFLTLSMAPSFEKPSSGSAGVVRKTLSAAAFAMLAGPFAAGCEDTPKVSANMEQIRREGERATMEKVLHHTIVPESEQPPRTLTDSTHLRIIADVQTATPGNRFSEAFRNAYMNAHTINTSTYTPGQADHALFRGSPRDGAALQRRYLELTYRATRTIVRDPERPLEDTARNVRMLGQQVTVRITQERRPPEGVGPISEVRGVGPSYAAALNQIFLGLIRPAEGVVDAAMQHDRTEAINNHVRFEGETCGPITTPGMENLIFCTRAYQKKDDTIVINEISHTTLPSGLVEVIVGYRRFAISPATPGR